MLTEEQHQEWKKDLEELHSVKAENAKLIKENRWIPVGERLPKLITSPPNAASKGIWLIWNGEACNGYYTNFDGWRIYGNYQEAKEYQNEITHWKPIILPKP